MPYSPMKSWGTGLAYSVNIFLLVPAYFFFMLLSSYCSRWILLCALLKKIAQNNITFDKNFHDSRYTQHSNNKKSLNAGQNMGTHPCYAKRSKHTSSELSVFKYKIHLTYNIIRSVYRIRTLNYFFKFLFEREREN